MGRFARLFGRKPRVSGPAPRRRRLSLENLENRQLLAGDFHLAANPPDVDASGFVSLFDTLEIVRDLRMNGPVHDLIANPPADETPRYYDVTGDDLVNAADLLATVRPQRDGAGLPTPTFLAEIAEPGAESETSIPRFIGQITGGLTDGAGLVAQVIDDQGTPRPWVRVELDAQGAFDFFAPLALDGSDDGDYTLRLVVQNYGGPFSELTLPFTLRTSSLGIKFISPAHGEEMVSVTRETVVHFEGKVDPATVTPDSFYVLAHGERVPGRVVVSSTREFATFFYDQPLPPSTAVRVVVDGEQILLENGSKLDANGDGRPGGIAKADFRTLPLTRIPGTNVWGYLKDAYTGEPIVGATIRVDGFPEANAVTDENGRYDLFDMPAPMFFVHIDGSTATSAPEGFVYPIVGKPFPSVPGETIQMSMNGEPLDLFLPPVAAADSMPLSMTEPTHVGFGAEGLAELRAMFPDVDPAMLEKMQVTIAPGSAQFENGTPATQATIVPVPPDRLPGPLPPTLNPELIVSVQLGGATNFDQRAPITFPNLEGLAPGEKSLIFSFNHDAGRWDVTGTGTVSADGLSIVSDPGSGLPFPGWHGTQSGTQHNEEVRRPGVCGASLDSAFSNAFTQASALVLSGMSTILGVADLVPWDAIPGVGQVVDGLLGPASVILGGLADEIATGMISTATAEQAILAGISALGSLAGNPVISTIADVESLIIGIESTVGQYDRTADAFGNFFAQLGRCLTDMALRPSLFSFEGEDSAIELETRFRQVLAGLRADAANTLVVTRAYLTIFDLLRTAPPGPISDPAVIDQLRGLITELDQGVAHFEALDATSFRDATRSRRADIEQIRDELVELLQPVTVPAAGVYYRATVGGVSISGQTDAQGNWSTVLGPNQVVSLTYYDPATGLSWTDSVITGESGSRTQEVRLILTAGGDDSDGDGLTDVAELAIGTISTSVDSDNDGINDLAEIQQGLNPLDDRGFPTGIVATLPLRGEAKAVTVEGSTLNAERQTAYVATGTYGLAIVDAARFNNPVVLGQLDLPGDNTDVAVDSQLQIAAVAGKHGGLHLVDVSDPQMPVLHQTLPVYAAQVEVVDGVAYVATDAELRAYDLLTGERLATLKLPGNGTVTSLAREHDRLYGYVSGSNTLFVVDMGSGQPTLLGQLNVDVASFDVGLAVGNGVAYLAGSGLRTVDVSDPANLQLLGDAQSFFTARHVALNGSGLGLLATEDQGVGIYNVADPQNTNAVVTVIDTPGIATHVAIGAGITFVADGGAGLHVINYLPFDNRGQAPTVNLLAGVFDQDPETAGVQIVEGTSVPIRVDVTDDVQVRNVELLVDGRVVRNDVSFPFDFSAIAVRGEVGATSVTVQVRATDTGGNVTLSDPLVFDLVPDTFAPTIIKITPADGVTATHGLRRLEVEFSEPMAAATINPNNFRLRDSAGNAIPLRNLQLRANDRIVQLVYDPLAKGDYIFTIDAAATTDRSGNPLGGAAIESSFTLVEVRNVWTNDAGGSWHDPSNWSEGTIPGPLDDVIIDLPGDYEIYFEDDVEIGSLTLGGATGTQVLDSGNHQLKIHRFAEIGGHGVLEVHGQITAEMISGSGAVHFLSGETVLGGGYNISGETVVSGVVTVEGFIQNFGKVLRIEGGTLDLLDAILEINTLEFTGGVLAGTGEVTVTGQMDWSGGVMRGAGVTRIAPGAVLNQWGATELDGRTLENAGTVNFVDPDGFDILLWLSEGATLRNLPGGVLDVQSELTVHRSGSNSNTLDNQGLLRKSGPGEARIWTLLHNSGAVEVQEGRLGALGGGVSSGAFTVAAGAVLEFTDDHMLDANSTISGAGDVEFTNFGTTTISGVYNVSGATRISAGTIRFVGITNLGGDYVQTGGKLQVEIAVGMQDQLQIAGNATLGGTLEVTFVGGFDPLAGSSFDVLTYSSREGVFDNVIIDGLFGGKVGEEEYLATRLRVNILVI